MEKIARTGDFCPNEDYPEYGKLQTNRQQNIKKADKTSIGVQRFQCKTCQKAFTETWGTIERVKGHKEDTILQWLRDATQHAGSDP